MSHIAPSSLRAKFRVRAGRAVAVAPRPARTATAVALCALHSSGQLLAGAPPHPAPPRHATLSLTRRARAEPGCVTLLYRSQESVMPPNTLFISILTHSNLVFVQLILMLVNNLGKLADKINLGLE